MKKLSKTYKKLGIAFTFPIEIKDSNGNLTYHEDSDGFWSKSEYDTNGRETYFENSNGEKRGTPSSQSCAGKIVEVDGKKYKLMEL
jgi:hypothetical protein